MPRTIFTEQNSKEVAVSEYAHLMILFGFARNFSFLSNKKYK